MNTLPEGLDFGNAMEINFVIQKFRELPDADKVRLSNAIRGNDEESKWYAEAGLEVFGVVNSASEELTTYANSVLYDGEAVIDMYFIVPGNFPKKAARCTKYFRDELSPEPDSFVIPDIVLPERRMRA